MVEAASVLFGFTTAQSLVGKVSGAYHRFIPIVGNLPGYLGRIVVKGDGYQCLGLVREAVLLDSCMYQQGGWREEAEKGKADKGRSAHDGRRCYLMSAVLAIHFVFLLMESFVSVTCMCCVR